MKCVSSEKWSSYFPMSEFVIDEGNFYGLQLVRVAKLTAFIRFNDMLETNFNFFVSLDVHKSNICNQSHRHTPCVRSDPDEESLVTYSILRTYRDKLY